MEQSIILVKPDTIKRKLLPKLKQMLYKENLEIINTLEVKLTENIIYDFQPFLKDGKKIKETDRQKIIKSLCQDPVLLFAIEENKALNKVKNIKTKFRKKYAPSDSLKARAIYNLLHAPNSEEELFLLLKALPQIV